MSTRIVAPICPWHGLPAVLVENGTVYRRSFGRRIWICPETTCDARVGAHPDGKPKGSLADARLRNARIVAHAAFDGWWQRHGINRAVAYRELTAVMGQAKQAHIGEMTEAECAQVVAAFAHRGDMVAT